MHEGKYNVETKRPHTSCPPGQNRRPDTNHAVRIPFKEKLSRPLLAFLCSSYAAPVLENNPEINLIIKNDQGSLWNLAQRIRELKFDASVHFYLDKRCEIASFLGGVPLRIGPFSKPTALFLNERIKQDRSKALQHEAEYNMDLARLLADDGSSYPPKIFITDSEKREEGDPEKLLTNFNVLKPVIIHPGSSGSATNWPLENFLKLATMISAANQDVYFTAGKGEEYIAEKVMSLRNLRIRHIPAGSLTLRRLIIFISRAQSLISNSTGPLHIASALNIPTLSFYPNTPVATSAKRWRPFGNDAITRVLSPKTGTDNVVDNPGRSVQRTERNEHSGII